MNIEGVTSLEIESLAKAIANWIDANPDYKCPYTIPLASF
jgi:hypothetical protein